MSIVIVYVVTLSSYEVQRSTYADWVTTNTMTGSFSESLMSEVQVHKCTKYVCLVHLFHSVSLSCLRFKCTSAQNTCVLCTCFIQCLVHVCGTWDSDMRDSTHTIITSVCIHFKKKKSVCIHLTLHIQWL